MARAVILLTGSLALCENSVTPQHLQRMTGSINSLPLHLANQAKGGDDVAISWRQPAQLPY
jgi:hypothetical protein